MTEKHLTDQKFTDLPLVESLQLGLKDAGFEFCTPIQAQSLPPALEEHDIAGQAQTGTGKTIAFLLACCNLLLTKNPLEGYQPGEPRALMLAPTRELAIQIHKDALLLNKYTGLSIGLVYGGTGYEQQKEMLAGKNDILIGTPGRLIDFFKQGLFSLKHAQVAVLDEADRMFDLGFIKDIRYLLRKMPPAEQRLNLLYSATLSFRVMELAYEHMNDPMEIKIDTDEVVAAKIIEYSYYPADEEKLPLLVNLVKQVDQERVLVFVNTRFAAEDVSRTLDANGFSTAMLSGDVPQNKRERLLEQFKSGERKILVATDVAARGLHIPSVSHVYNFDLPQDAEDYVHRIGRTARAGASGEAVSFICEKYAYSILDIEEYIGHPLPRKDIDQSLLESIEPTPKRPRKDRSGKRRDDRQHASRRTRGANQVSEKSPRTRGKPAEVQVIPVTPNEGPVSQEMATPSVVQPISQEAPVQLSENPILSEISVPSIERPLSPEISTQPTRKSLPPALTGRGAMAFSSPAITPANPDQPPRFSRRFGEIPAIG